MLGGQALPLQEVLQARQGIAETLHISRNTRIFGDGSAHLLVCSTDAASRQVTPLDMTLSCCRIQAARAPK